MRVPVVLAALVVLAAGASAPVLPATQPAQAPAPAPHTSDLHAGHGDHGGPAHPSHPAPPPGEHGGHADATSLDPSAGAGPGPGDFAWSSPEGRIPARDDPGLRRLRSLDAVGDRGLAELAAQGYVQGKGTREAPYVIEGLRVAKDLSLSDTAAYVIVRNNAILGQLTLNWNGDKVHVHHNGIHDLRINENVARTGDVTGGLLERNKVGFIGQMRHYSGEFRENTIGPKPAGPFEAALGDTGPFQVGAGEVWNFDGFHGARVHHNVAVGNVNIKLHGHHHGSSYAAGSHDHADKAGRSEGVDHTLRYHWLSFTQNTITVPSGAALIYRDTPHAGDDRTATSETNPELELAHVHHTFVELSENKLQGGGLVLRVFNSADERHLGGDQGSMSIARNKVHFPAAKNALGVAAAGSGVGFDLHDAQGLKLRLEGNEVTFEPPTGLLGGKAKGTGILLRGWAGSDLGILDNAVRGADVGLRARDFDEATSWALLRNSLDARVPVDYDGSVANEPS